MNSKQATDDLDLDNVNIIEVLKLLLQLSSYGRKLRSTFVFNGMKEGCTALSLLITEGPIIEHRCVATVKLHSTIEC